MSSACSARLFEHLLCMWLREKNKIITTRLCALLRYYLEVVGSSNSSTRKFLQL